MTATIKQIDEAKDVAIRCYRSFVALQVHAHSWGRQTWPIDEVQTQLADAFRVLARIHAEGCRKITHNPEVREALLLAVDPSVPPSPGLWHAAAVQSLVAPLSGAECVLLVTTGEGGCEADPGFLAPATGDVLRSQIMAAPAEVIVPALLEMISAIEDDTGPVDNGIEREWAAVRRHLQQAPGATCYVDLTQCAAIVNRAKRTLEDWKRNDRSFPIPEVEGGGGKPCEWKWDTIRPYLSKKAGRDLPETFPADRFVRR